MLYIDLYTPLSEAELIRYEKEVDKQIREYLEKKKLDKSESMV